jgi:CheY-like chemotaxis protein
MFVQIEPTGHRARSGLGIGLALARRLVELHEGTLEAFSDGIGKGATFVVRLPAISTERCQPAGPSPRRVASSCRVLVAEDIPDAAEMMRLMIEAMGHDVRVAADGVQAMEVAQVFQPEIALLDIGMPRMDGYEAARRIRAVLGGQITLVALTGWGQEHDRQRAFAAGFDYHVMKPAEPDALESLIASVVKCP